jgi:hypothetical protein
MVCEDAANTQMHLEMPSPDEKKVLVVQGWDVSGPIFLFLKSDRKHEHPLLGGPTVAWDGSEVLWSLDSKAVAVTTCFGGLGPCVVATTEANTSPTDVVKDAFSAGHKDDACFTNANVGALTWENSSDMIVVIAEVPPSPQCRGHNEG